MEDLYALFGTRIANALLRNGVHSIEELKEYNTQYPIEEWFGYGGQWRCIGPKAYEKIMKYLIEESG